MKTLKIFILIVLAAFSLSCEKEDTCDCYYSDLLKQYVPSQTWEQAAIDKEMTYERRKALDAECRNKGCN